MYLDRYGFPVQADGDTGDVASNFGWLWYCLNFLKNSLKISPPDFKGLVSFEAGMDLLEPRKDGWLVRHPDRMDFLDFSRDQQIGIIHALGRFKMKKTLWRIFKAHAKRFFFYQNKDVPGLEIPCLYIRAFRAWYLWPLLLFFDLNLLINSIVKTGIIPIYHEDRKSWALPTPNDVDDKNHNLMITEGLDIFPTPLSVLAALIYAHLRQKNDGNLILGEKSRVMGAVAWYFRAESKNNPEVGEVDRIIIAKMLDSKALK